MKNKLTLGLIFLFILVVICFIFIFIQTVNASGELSINRVMTADNIVYLILRDHRYKKEYIVIYKTTSLNKSVAITITPRLEK